MSQQLILREWLFVTLACSALVGVALITLARGQGFPEIQQKAAPLAVIEEVEVIGALKKPGLYSWPKELAMQQFIKEHLQLEEHAEPLLASLTKRQRQKRGQLRIPSVEYDYLYCKGAIASEGWYPIPKGCSWQLLPLYLPVTKELDKKKLSRLRSKFKAWQQITLPKRISQ